MQRAGRPAGSSGPVGAIDDAARLAFASLLADAPSAVEPLLRSAHMIRVRAGDVVMEDNQPPFAGVLVEGRLRTVVTLPDGRSASIHYVRPPAFFGLPTVFIPTLLSVHAMTEATAIALAPAAVVEAGRSQPGFGWLVARQLAVAVSRAPSIIEQFGFKTVQQRVAVHLLALADAGGDVHVTQAKLAEYVGSAREVVTRGLHALAEAGLVANAHGRVRILDAAGLREEAGVVDAGASARPAER